MYTIKDLEHLKNAYDADNKNDIIQHAENTGMGLLTVLYLGGKERAKLFLKYIPLGKNESPNELLVNAINLHLSNPPVITDLIELLSDQFGSKGIMLTDSEAIFYMIQDPDNSLDILKKLIEYNIKFDFRECFTSGAYYCYKKHYYYLSNNVTLTKADFSEYFELLISNPKNQSMEGNYIYVSEIIEDLINNHNVDVNMGDLGMDFDYAVHQCLYYYPFSVKYFLTKNFDISLLEDPDFWKEFCDGLGRKVQYYPIAFQQIKASGITFDDSIMLSALKSEGLDELINAYVNEPNGKS
ncbi:hypothetical protein ACU5DF_00650 [Aliivibrio wodanis]|uniref:hypothetical protein n=1 Tax=Aliivibrio wodanis TaxID=80852 RepID=UPI00406C3C4D